MTLSTATSVGIGTVLRDTYEIVSLLGQGGMGAVFLARHRRLPGRQVAVKVLHSGANLNPELYTRFRREAEIASQLGHPHIVEVLDFDSLQDGTPFLVMEYLRGESLEQRLQRGPLPLAEALSLARQMGSALQAAHRAGIVHRDLKPANVFLVPTESGGRAVEHVKLLDFGISKIIDSQTLQTQEAMLIGTPQYMSPEQALGKNREVDARTDLFALGSILYEALSGSSAFGADGGSLVQVVYRVVHEQPAPLASLCPDLPAHVLSAVERALSKSPQERHPDVASFIAELTGSPLLSQPEAGAAPPVSLLTAPTAAPGSTGEVGFAPTLVPSSTARRPAPEEVGFADTLVPSATARTPAPQDVGFADTLVPAATARTPASPSPTARFEAASSPAVAPASDVLPAQGRSKGPVTLAVGVGLLVLGVGAAGWWFGASRAPAPASSVQASTVAPSPAPAVAAPAPPALPVAEAPRAEEPSAARPPATTEKATAPATGSKPVPPAPRSSPAEALPEKVREALRSAEQALAAGNPDEAIRLALRSQREQVSGESFSLLTRAYCRKRDLSNANANWRKVPPAQRSQVQAYCGEQGINLRK